MRTTKIFEQYSARFSGVAASFLRESIVAAGAKVVQRLRAEYDGASAVQPLLG